MSIAFAAGLLDGGLDRSVWLGRQMGGVFNDMRQGASMGEARRAASAEAERLNSTLMDVDTGRSQWLAADGQSFGNARDATRYAQETGLALPKRQAVTQKKKRGDVLGEVDAENLYLQTYLPQQVKQLRDKGWNTQADALENYIAGEVGQRHTRAYANMLKAHAAGNFDQAAKYMEQIQEMAGEDTDATVKANGQGGYQVQLRNRKSGAEVSHDLDESRLVGDMGFFAHTDPVRMLARADAAASTRAKALGELANTQAETRKALLLEGVRHRYTSQEKAQDQSNELERITTREAMATARPGEIDRKVSVLRQLGASDAEIRQALAGDKGGGDGNIRLRLHGQMMQSYDPPEGFDKPYSQLSAQQQRQVLDRTLQQVVGQPTAAKAPPASPAAGLPMWRP